MQDFNVISTRTNPPSIQNIIPAPGNRGGFLTKEKTMLCTVIDIRGDYAYIKYDDTGVVSEVAIALLPFGIDTGDRLRFENYEFTQI
jgi:hypothetical protein